MIISVSLGLLVAVDFYRRELERERNAQSNLLYWYILPVVPGVSVMTVRSP